MAMVAMADLWEFVGPPGDDARKVSSMGMMRKIIHPVLSSMPNPIASKPDASRLLSALDRAQMDDEAIAIAAIADRFNQALKPFEYREYTQSSKGWLLEWCALVDLDGDSSTARGACN